MGLQSFAKFGVWGAHILDMDQGESTETSQKIVTGPTCFLECVLVQDDVGTRKRVPNIH